MKVKVIKEVELSYFENSINRMYEKFHIDHVDTHIGNLNEFIAIVFYDDKKKNLSVDMNMPISDLNIPSISRNALRRNNILTVGELIEYLQEDPDGRYIRNLGKTGINEIHARLKDLGVRMKFDKE